MLDYCLMMGAWELGYSHPLGLTLFVLGVFTDHPDHPFTFDDLTLVTDLFD